MLSDVVDAAVDVVLDTLGRHVPSWAASLIGGSVVVVYVAALATEWIPLTVVTGGVLLVCLVSFAAIVYDS